MSCYLMLNNWVGEDQETASDKVARIFRMDPQQANEVVDNLVDGNPWQFEHQISNQQSEVAERYLRGMGFDVECIPIMDEDFGFDMGEDNGAAPEKKKGFFSKIMSMFSKKR